MNIMILVGSGSVKSHSLGIGEKIALGLENEGLNTELVNLVELKFPLFNREIDRNKTHDKNLAEFLEKSKKANGFVWITPIYHNSFSSVLKNALDWQHFMLDGKVVAMASNGGNRSTVAVDQLMLIARSQHMITLPERICTQESDFDDNLNITDVDILNRIEHFTKAFKNLTEIYS